MMDTHTAAVARASDSMPQASLSERMEAARLYVDAMVRAAVSAGPTEQDALRHIVEGEITICNGEVIIDTA
jgi:hypothetical protein